MAPRAITSFPFFNTFSVIVLFCLLNFYPINGNTGVRAHGCAVGAAGACLGILHIDVVVSFAVDLFSQRNGFGGAVYNANAAAFAFFCIYHNCSF